MTDSKLITISLIVAAALGFIAAFTGFTGVASGSAPMGQPANQRVATTTQVGPQETKTVFAANTSCASRIIRTQAVDIYLLFADTTNGNLASTTLSGAAGFFQAASTTVAYDGGIYGCGRVTVEAVSSTTISVAEMQ